MRATISESARTPLLAAVASLPALLFFINLGGLGLLAAYSLLNLRPDLSAIHGPEPHTFVEWSVFLAVVAPALASLTHVWPILRWLRRGDSVPARDVPAAIAERAANAPLALAAFSLLGWILVTGPAVVMALAIGSDMPIGLAVHLVVRPLLAGLIAGTATFFAAEIVCRGYLWPALLAGTQIAANPRLRRVRVSHRLLVLWLAISVFPLGAVALTTYARVAGVDLAEDPLLGRVVSVVLLIAVSAALGGAWLAWLVSRSIARPLEALEVAMSQLREGRFDTRVQMQSTDETGTLAEGFNLMAGRLAGSYAALEARSRELAEALHRVQFLEHVKRGLDRFVPDTVRRAIEKNPEAPGLEKKPKDVTVLFLDIEGYSRLSEQLPRRELDALVERYFSLFLAPIRAGGGDINETAGDGLMIVFQSGAPEEHAAAAARASLAIREATGLANQEGARGHPPIKVNVGISSGECEVGTTRFEGPAGERWTFTASGPVTNLAARLGAHATGGQILLSPETARRIRDRFALRNVGLTALKNLAQAVEVWQLE